jgi:diaminopimelate epimerase
MLCGNGARCAVQAARDWGRAPGAEVDFEVLSAINHAELLSDGNVRVHFQDPVLIEPHVSLEVKGETIDTGYVDVGSQHIVISIDALKSIGVTDIESLAIAELGPQFRYHAAVMPKGANANFIEIREDGDEKYIRIRTYERGVEGETLACGTGCMSSAIVAYLTGSITELPIRLETQSGEFVVVNFEVHGEAPIVRQLTLEGSAIRGESGVLFFEEVTGDLAVRYD